MANDNWGGTILGLLTIIIVVAVLFLSATTSLNSAMWHCTASQRIGDTMPEEYQCVEYRRK